MERVYKYKTGTIYVSGPDECDRKKLEKVTEEFLKKVIKERMQYGNSNTPGDINKE